MASIKTTISQTYWDMPTLLRGLDFKNIDYPANISKSQAKYLIETFFQQYYKEGAATHPLDPFPTLADFRMRESMLLRKSFKQSIAVGLLYYNLIRDGWIGFSFQQSVIYWFNINKPCHVNENGRFYIERKIAIWIPTTAFSLNYLQMLNKIQFICRQDLPACVGA